jgi:hypothetical protein
MNKANCKLPSSFDGLWAWWGRNKALRRFVAVLLWVPLVFGGCALLLDEALDTCSNTVGVVATSPDGVVKAVAFGRGCMMSEGDSTQMVLLPAKKSLPNKWGDTFSIDTNERKVATAKWGGPPVKVMWKSNTRLQVVYPANARVFRSKARATVQTGWFARRDVTIEYRQATKSEKL